MTRRNTETEDVSLSEYFGVLDEETASELERAIERLRERQTSERDP